MSKLFGRLGAARLNYFVHVGNLLAVGALWQTDMLYLRSLMIGATTCNIAFNVLQPKPLMAPAWWGSFFIAGHGIQIVRLLMERSNSTSAFSEREIDAYEQTFHGHGLLPRQFHRLLKEGGAKWLEFQPGDKIARAGSSAEEVMYLHSGSADVDKGGIKVGEFGRSHARFIGAFHLFEEISTAAGASEDTADAQCTSQHTWNSTITVTEPSVVIVWPLESLQKAMTPNDVVVLKSIVMDDLHTKLKTSMQQGNASVYAEAVRMAASDGHLSPEEVVRLRDLRSKLSITDKQHQQLLEECGFSDQLERPRDSASIWNLWRRLSVAGGRLQPATLT